MIRTINEQKFSQVLPLAEGIRNIPQKMLSSCRSHLYALVETDGIAIGLVSNNWSTIVGELR